MESKMETDTEEHIFEKPNRGDRLMRSEAARSRRKETKQIKLTKEEKEEQQLHEEFYSMLRSWK